MTDLSLIDQLKQTVQSLEAAFDAELAERRKVLHYRLEKRRAVFDRDVLALHRQMRISLRDFLAAARPMVILTAPVIYSLILPFALLDLFVTVYQAICFPVYGIAKVRRGDHIVVDRHRLAYLNALQKLNCTYCSYCNGIISYVREIAGRTELYWCPIRHAARVAGSHARYRDFVDFGDAEAYVSESQPLRDSLRPKEE